MVKGILIDIDNTLYDYALPHNKAINAVISEAGLYFDDEEFLKKYKIARTEIHKSLKGTAASHNRLLYFQKTLELLNYHDFILAKKLYDIYWNTFLNNIVVFDGVTEFFEYYKDKKVCFITDLTALIQYKKLEKTKLYKYADYIVTSEEAGSEKPSRKIFKIALKKINLQSHDVCMIGDNYDKDICGALALGIKSYWKTDKYCERKELTVFKDFKEITGKI